VWSSHNSKSKAPHADTAYLGTRALVHETVERLIDYDEWFISKVEGDLAQIDRCEVLEHEEAAARMDEPIAEKQHPK